MKGRGSCIFKIKKSVHSIFVFIIAVLFAISSLPVSAVSGYFSLSDKASELIGSVSNFGSLSSERSEPLSGAVNLNDAVFKSQAYTSAASPYSYDSRSYGRVTPVKNQNLFGLCWSFSAVASAESSLIAQGYADKSIDLSEMQFAYFTYNKAYDKRGMTGGDYAMPGEGQNAWNVGGNNYISTFTMAKWVGLTEERNAAYESVEETSERFTEYYNTDELYDDKMIYDKDNYHLQNAYWVSMADKNAAKQLIMKYGGIAVAFNPGDSYYNSKYAAYYDSSEESTGHIVTVIGWDDNFSRDKFYDGKMRRKPQNNGAWLCKNSWGEELCDKGYIWISYEDVSLKCEYAAAFVMQDAGNYEKNYQYDGGTSNFFYTGETLESDKGYMANVFTAEDDEVLKAVSFYSFYPNVNYTVQIYKDVAVGSNPTDGTPCFQTEQSGTMDYAGYITVPLKQKISLNKGQRFSVMVSMQGAGGAGKRNYSIFLDRSTSMNDSGGKVLISQQSRAENGQSFMSADGVKWNDTSVLFVLPGGGFKGSSKGNIRIKAFTVKKENDGKKLISGSAKIIGEAKIGNTVYADASYIKTQKAAYVCDWYLDGEWVYSGQSYTLGSTARGKLLLLKIRGTGDFGGEVESEPINAADSLGYAYISNVRQLDAIRYNPGGRYKLANDIDIDAFEYEPGGFFYHSERGFAPISPNKYSFFTGELDGQGYTVRGIKILTDGRYKGIFGRTYGANIKNLFLENIRVSGSSYVGGLAGYVEGGTVSGCGVTGNISGLNFIGGLIGGAASNAAINNCQSMAQYSANASSDTAQSRINGFVTGSGNVGGIVGGLTGSRITGCSNYSLIKNTADSAGGTVGYSENSYVAQCVNYAEVSADKNAGGIVGTASYGSLYENYNCGGISGNDGVGGILGGVRDSSGKLTLTNSYNTGKVQSGAAGGGIAGFANAAAAITYCYNTGEVSAARYGAITGSGGTIKNCVYSDNVDKSSNNAKTDVSVKKLTKAQMLKKENYAGFDFTSVWTMSDAGYLLPDLLKNAFRNTGKTRFNASLTGVCSDKSRFVKFELRNNDFEKCKITVSTDGGQALSVDDYERGFEITKPGNYSFILFDGSNMAYRRDISVYSVNFKVEGIDIVSYISLMNEPVEPPNGLDIPPRKGNFFSWFDKNGREIRSFNSGVSLNYYGEYCPYGKVGGLGDKLSMADALMMFRYCVGVISLDDIPVPTALDFNCDEAVNLVDVLSLLLELKKQS